MDDIEQVADEEVADVEDLQRAGVVSVHLEEAVQGFPEAAVAAELVRQAPEFVDQAGAFRRRQVEDGVASSSRRTSIQNMTPLPSG